ncbi:stressosome-associated protein Prli42 [Planomicrobium sp. CPCC 101079]|nr:stressosome-associated protein Prli42 [Planomicrobium sp. CPCC 101079]
MISTRTLDNEGVTQPMRNNFFRKFVVYAMIVLMLLSSLMMGISFII